MRKSFWAISNNTDNNSKTAAALYSRLGVPVFDVTKYLSRESQTNTQLVEIATEIGVTSVNTVPSLGEEDSQYIEFHLAGHPSAPYGVIFVPPEHSRAMSTIMSETKPPARVYQRMRRISDRWFYFEYQ